MNGRFAGVPAEVRAQMEIENAKFPEHLELVPAETWKGKFAGAPSDLVPISVWRSKGFLVQIYSAPAPALVRLSINRTTLDGDRWAERISWDDLQRLKREACYGDFDAVEIYPRDADQVNVANIRHLWVMPADLLPFAWRRKP